MSALISAPDLDPFALISIEDYRIVREGGRSPARRPHAHMAQLLIALPRFQSIRGQCKLLLQNKPTAPKKPSSWMIHGKN